MDSLAYAYLVIGSEDEEQCRADGFISPNVWCVAAYHSEEQALDHCEKLRKLIRNQARWGDRKLSQICRHGLPLDPMLKGQYPVYTLNYKVVRTPLVCHLDEFMEKVTADSYEQDDPSLV